MSQRILALVLALAAVLPAHAMVEIVHVWPVHRTGDSFKRLSEYVGGRESTGRETVLRTHPENRDGLYFLVRTKADAPLPAATVVVEVVSPGSPDVRTFTFTAVVPSGGRVFHLGLTGADWPESAARPTAWRVSVRDSAGAVVAEAPSFLWTGPAPR